MKVLYEGGTKFAATVRGHKVVTDLPSDRGGSDEGMTPPELFIASFGACIGVYVTQACKQLGINPLETAVEVTWETANDPKRIGKLHAVVSIPAEVPSEHRVALLKAAESCLIDQTLRHPPEISIEIR